MIVKAPVASHIDLSSAYLQFFIRWSCLHIYIYNRLL